MQIQLFQYSFSHVILISACRSVQLAWKLIQYYILSCIAIVIPERMKQQCSKEEGMVHDLDSSTVNSKIGEDNPYGYRDSETTFGFVRRQNLTRTSDCSWRNLCEQEASQAIFVQWHSKWTGDPVCFYSYS